jgi:hypothetical protein
VATDGLINCWGKNFMIENLKKKSIEEFSRTIDKQVSSSELIDDVSFVVIEV